MKPIVLALLCSPCCLNALVASIVKKGKEREREQAVRGGERHSSGIRKLRVAVSRWTRARLTKGGSMLSELKGKPFAKLPSS